MSKRIAVALAVTIGAGLLVSSAAEARPEMVGMRGDYSPGTIVVKTGERRLYLVLDSGHAMRYPVGVGKAGTAAPISRALVGPIKQIAENAGEDGAVVAGRLLDKNDETWGFNASTDTYENLKAAGVIDPTKVVRTALQDAASVSGLLITTEAAISERPEDKPSMPAMPGGGMGGMDF